MNMIDIQAPVSTSRWRLMLQLCIFFQVHPNSTKGASHSTFVRSILLVLHSWKNCLTSYPVCLHEKEVTDEVAPEASEARATYRASASLLKKLIRVALRCWLAFLRQSQRFLPRRHPLFQGFKWDFPSISHNTLPLLQQLSLPLPIQHNFNRRTTFILSLVEVLEKKSPVLSLSYMIFKKIFLKLNYVACNPLAMRLLADCFEFHTYIFRFHQLCPETLRSSTSLSVA